MENGVFYMSYIADICEKGRYKSFAVFEKFAACVGFKNIVFAETSVLYLIGF